jgi:hypothetical protein
MVKIFLAVMAFAVLGFSCAAQEVSAGNVVLSSSAPASGGASTSGGWVFEPTCAVRTDDGLYAPVPCGNEVARSLHGKTWSEEQNELVERSLKLTLICEVKNEEGFCNSGHLSDGSEWRRQ